MLNDVYYKTIICLLSHPDSCFLGQDQGSCQNYTMMWFFDTEQNECSRFWYGGCGGNSNRFKTQEDCENLCLTRSRWGGRHRIGWRKSPLYTKHVSAKPLKTHASSRENTKVDFLHSWACSGRLKYKLVCAKTPSGKVETVPELSCWLKSFWVLRHEEESTFVFFLERACFVPFNILQ